MRPGGSIRGVADHQPSGQKGRWMAVSGVVVTLVVLSSGGCATPPAEAPVASIYRPSATLREVMHGIVAPSAAVIWDAVVTSSTAAGVEHKEPRTDEEWEVIEHGALTLLESSNLLLIPGRQVAGPGETADAPGIELEPARIAELIGQKQAEWTALVGGLHDSTAEVVDAAKKKDVQRLFDGGAAIYSACESCHRTFWFPDAIKGQ